FYRDIATLEGALGRTDAAAVALFQAIDIADDPRRRSDSPSSIGAIPPPSRPSSPSDRREIPRSTPAIRSCGPIAAGPGANWPASSLAPAWRSWPTGLARRRRHAKSEASTGLVPGCLLHG